MRAIKLFHFFGIKETTGKTMEIIRFITHNFQIEIGIIYLTP